MAPNVKARDLAVAYPTVSGSDDARVAAHLLARPEVDAVVVQGLPGGRLRALHDISLLTALLPDYVVQDPGLARVLADDAGTLWRRLEGRTVTDLLAVDAVILPTVGADDTLVEVASVMVQARSGLAAVVEGPELLGCITTSALLSHLLRDR